MESSAMPVCKENYLSGFGRDEFGACRAPDYSAPQSWSCFLMCSCGAPFHPLQSACVAGGGTNTRSHSRYLELIFWLLPRGHSCSTRAGASCRVNLLQGQARAGLRRKRGKNTNSQERRPGCSSFTSVGILSRCLALHTENVGSQMHCSCCSSS